MRIVIIGSGAVAEAFADALKGNITGIVARNAERGKLLAEMCGVSEVYFRAEFKKFYGASPLEYIKKICSRPRSACKDKRNKVFRKSR